MLRKPALYFGLIASLVLTAASAQASVFNFDFLASDLSYQIIGQVGLSDTPNGVTNGSSIGYDILSVGGVVNGPGGGPIFALTPNPNHPLTNVAFGFQYDNVGFSPAPFLDLYGVVFSLANGTIWNLWNNGGTDYELYSYAN